MLCPRQNHAYPFIHSRFALVNQDFRLRGNPAAPYSSNSYKCAVALARNASEECVRVQTHRWNFSDFVNLQGFLGNFNALGNICALHKCWV